MSIRVKFGKIALAVIIATVFFHTLVNFYIFDHSKILRLDDEGGYVWKGVRAYQRLMDKEYKEFFTAWDGYASRGFIEHVEGLALTFLSQFGLKDINSMILFTNTIFFLTLLISTYRIGSILYSEKVGLISAVLLSFSPQIFGHSRICMVDFPLTAMISLSFLCLLKTENFRSLFFSVLAGIAFCSAEWAKETAFIFILPVLLFYFFKSLSLGQKRKQVVINFSVTFSLMLLRAAMVYLTRNQYSLHRSLWKIFYKYNEFDYLCYIKSIPGVYFGIILFLVLIPPFLSYLYNIQKRNMFLFFWIFAPLLLFSIFPNRAARFLMPLLPPLFLLLIAEIFMRPFKAKKAYVTVAFIAAISQYAIFAFCPNFLLPKDRMGFGLLSIEQDKDFDKVQKITDILKKENPVSSKINRVVSTFYSFQSALHYDLAIRNTPFSIDIPQTGDVGALIPDGTVNWEKYLLDADYVLDKTGDLGTFRGFSEDISSALKKALEHNFTGFRKIGGFKIEGDDYIYLYKRIK